MMTFNTNLPEEKKHRLHRNRNGTLSIQHVPSGEVMHSSIGPEEESRLLYVEQSRLKNLLQNPVDAAVVLYDLGLGAGTNALAAIQAWKELDRSNLKPRSLLIHSFENDLEGFSLAIENAKDLPFFDGLEDLSQTLLDNKEAVLQTTARTGVKWVLHVGDFAQIKMPSEKADLLFFDFYSPKTTPELWRLEIFEKIKRSCHQGSTLFTYSSATRIRTAMLLAGLYVGSGQSTGAKNETSVASLSIDNLLNPLGHRWLEKLKRSDKKYPFGWNEDQEQELLDRISCHPQFKVES